MIEVIPNWHPIFVHFTVAMLTISAVLFFVGHIAKPSAWQQQSLIVAKWNFWVGALSAVVTAIAGWYAYNTVAHDTPSHAAMTEHRNWALAFLVVVSIVALWLVRMNRVSQIYSKTLLVGLLISISLLGVTAWHGGELVYRYGLGVMSMPVMEKNTHDGGDHAHDDSIAKEKVMPKTVRPEPKGHEGHNHDH